MGISRRGYGDAARGFLVDLKTRRAQDIAALSTLPWFEIRLPAPAA